MNLLDIHALRGPNYWSIRWKVIELKLNIGKYEELPTNKLIGFHDRIRQMLPGLDNHFCSEGKPGGFLERVKRGTWIGHVIEHIALEIQIQAGMDTGFGRTRGTGEPGIYSVVFAYTEERAGLYAAHAAIRIAESICEGRNYDVGADIQVLRKIVREDGAGPSTSAIVKAAIERNIPFMRLDNGSFLQFGYGCRQKRIEATITDSTSSIAVDLASDKLRTKAFLKAASLPVPEGFIIKDKSELTGAIGKIGIPLVIKPNNGNQGKGVTLNILTPEKAAAAFEKARKFSDEIIVEKYFAGNDYRLLIIDYKLVAAAHRSPAMVTGDGISAIRELVEKVNSDPSRGDDHENSLTKIRIDEDTVELLKSQDMSPDHIPGPDQKIYLKQTANLSTGGTAEDVTDLVNPQIKDIAERAARVIGLDICGIDLISEDISASPLKSKTVIIEINAAPGFRMHTNPYKGIPRPAGEAVINMLFPSDRNNGRIPVVAVTGTNGKTTTARLLAFMAKKAGYIVGSASSNGIYIDNQIIEEGDCTGPVSAGKVLSDRKVEFAVLECARGGILRSGLAFDQCDTGIVTNVAEDHLGLKGINTIEEMAKVKSIIPETVKPGGFAILNADNEYTYKMKDGLKCNIALFSTDASRTRITEHLGNNGIAAFYRNGRVVLQKGKTMIFSESVEHIPLVFGGKAFFMIENILAAILAAYTNGIDVFYISKSLRTFVPSFENIPGRMNLIEFSNFSFLLDYAHNFHGISALGSFIRQHEASVKVGIVSAAGDRRDIDLINVGKASAEVFDKIIIRVDEDTRGRDENEIINLIHSGIKQVSANMAVEVIRSEYEAIRQSLYNAVPDSLIVLLSDNVKKSYEVIQEFKLTEQEILNAEPAQSTV